VAEPIGLIAVSHHPERYGEELADLRRVQPSAARKAGIFQNGEIELDLGDGLSLPRRIASGGPLALLVAADPRWIEPSDAKESVRGSQSLRLALLKCSNAP
jgi:hypothetical protein